MRVAAGEIQLIGAGKDKQVLKSKSHGHKIAER